MVSLPAGRARESGKLTEKPGPGQGSDHRLCGKVAPVFRPPPPSTVTCHSLSRHPACPASGEFEIVADAGFTTEGSLRLDYVVRGDLAGLRIPAPQPPAAADGLWQHSCCEAFVAAVDAAGYREFNLSPSGCWAAYRFADYRDRDADWLPPAAPCLEVTRGDGELRLSATLPATLLPGGKCLALGLTVVLEHTDGSKSYWALRHGGLQPDFHLRESFALELLRP